MEIIIAMNILKPNEADESFELTALTWDMQRNSGLSWKRSRQDKSFLLLGHIMEQAFQTNKLTFSYHGFPYVSIWLLEAQRDKSRLEAALNFLVKNSTGGLIWKAEYSFEFKVENVFVNQKLNSGKRYNYAIVKIIDKTEKMRFSD